MISDIFQMGWMARKASLITCSEEAKQTLERLAASRTEAKQTV